MPTVFQYSLYLPTFNLQPFMRYHRSKVINNFLPTANGGEQKSVDRGKQDRKQRHKSIHCTKKLSADFNNSPIPPVERIAIENSNRTLTVIM
jgi:hypothetical protein